MKALVHRKKPADSEWHHEVQNFAQLPRIGEHFALRPEGPFYQIKAVFYCHFRAHYEAEVFALEDGGSMSEILRKNAPECWQRE